MKEITFNCPACDYPLTVPASAAGQTGPCPECGEEITGPGLDPEEEPEDHASPEPDEDQPAPDPTQEPEAKPNADPEPKAKEPAPAAVTPAPSPRRIGLGAAAALILLSAIACFSLGYQLGQKSNISSKSHPDPSAQIDPADANPPQPAPKIPDTPPAPTPPDPDGTTGVTPEPAPSPAPAPSPGEAETTPDQAALLAFLAAADWNARRDLVLHADLVAADMETRSQSLGDGPLTATRITPMHRTATSVVYQVATPEHPNGFPIALSLVDDRWLVDWQSFAEFRYQLFQAFTSDPAQTTGTFRVLIKPELAGLGDTDRQPYSASTPGMTKTTTLYAPDDSEEYQVLEDIIGALAARAPGSFRRLMESGGVPMILELSKKTDGDQNILMIDAIVDQGWSPRPPETP